MLPLSGSKKDGAWWICPRCGEVNPSQSHYCSSCRGSADPGSPWILDPRRFMDEGPEPLDEPFPEPSVPSQLEDDQLPKPSVGPEPEEAPGVPPPPVRPRRARRVLGAFLALVLSTAGAVSLGRALWHSTRDATVVDAWWETSVGVEVPVIRKEQAWLDQVPGDVRILRRWEAQRGTAAGPDGEEEAVYGVRVEYEVVLWKEMDRLVKRGRPPQEVAWPEVAEGPSQRAGVRKAEGILRFSSSAWPQRLFTVEVAPARLETVRPGNGLRVVINGFGMVLSVTQDGQRVYP